MRIHAYRLKIQRTTLTGMKRCQIDRSLTGALLHSTILALMKTTLTGMKRCQGCPCCPVAPDGKLMKYQPLMNEVEKAMVKQMLKINVPHILEPSIIKLSSFLIDDAQSFSTALAFGSSLSQNSEAALFNTLSASGHACMEAEISFPVCSKPASVSQVQSLPDAVDVAQSPDVDSFTYQ